MKNKVLITFFLLFLGIAAVSGVYYFWPTNKLTTNNEQLTINKPSADEYLAPSPSPKKGGTNEEINSQAKRDSSPPETDQNDPAPDAARRYGASSADSRFRGNDSSNSSTSATPSLKMAVVIVAGDKTYPLSVLPSTTVYEAMQLLQIDSRQPFIFSAKKYSGMGYFVEEINGVKNDTKTNAYWIMYINSQSAQVGAAQYILKEGDKIEWKFEKAKF